jgi:signal transduction histidine kinase
MGGAGLAQSLTERWDRRSSPQWRGRLLPLARIGVEGRAIWLERLEAVGAVAMVVLAAVAIGGGGTRGLGLEVRAAAVGVILLPAIVHTLGFTLRDEVIALCILIPTALLALIDGNRIVEMFLVLLVGRAALVASPGTNAGVLVASLLIPTVDALRGTGTALPWTLLIALAWATGQSLRHQYELLARLECVQEDLEQRSALVERQRIARDIHDVIAHSLSVTTLYLGSARLAIEEVSPEAAAALKEAERLARESLADVRRTVGLLTPSAGVTPSTPPSAIDIPRLVTQFQRAGMEVNLCLSGDPASLSAAPHPSRSPGECCQARAGRGHRSRSGRRRRSHQAPRPHDGRQVRRPGARGWHT